MAKGNEMTKPTKENLIKALDAGDKATVLGIYDKTSDMAATERRSAWAALRMIADAIGERFGPAANLESEEASLFRGPEYHHYAEAIVAALLRIPAPGEVGECRYCANTGWFYGDADLATLCGCAFGKLRGEIAPTLETAEPFVGAPAMEPVWLQNLRGFLLQGVPFRDEWKAIWLREIGALLAPAHDDLVADAPKVASDDPTDEEVIAACAVFAKEQGYVPFNTFRLDVRERWMKNMRTAIVAQRVMRRKKTE